MNNYTNGLEARIEHLLARYYEGETTPDEELELYALLLDVREGEPYYTDAVLLRSQYERPVEPTPVAEPSPAAHPIFLRRRWLWPATMAAALVAVGLGLWLLRPSEDPLMAQRNGAAMTQEEVNVVVDDAVMRLATALDNSNAKSQQVLMLLEHKLR